MFTDEYVYIYTHLHTHYLGFISGLRAMGPQKPQQSGQPLVQESVDAVGVGPVDLLRRGAGSQVGEQTT